MIEMDQLLAAIQERKGEWKSLARDAGVPYSTFEKIARGTTERPRIDNVVAIWKQLKKRKTTMA